MIDVRMCFQEWHEREPQNDVNLLVRFVVAPSGEVISTAARGSADTVLRQCVSGLLSRLSFPPKKRGTAVSYLFSTVGNKLETDLKVEGASPPGIEP